MELIQSDVQSELKPDLIELNQVGMSDVQVSMELNDLLIPVRLAVFVDLRPGHRGIHMSRLYEIVLQNLHHKKIDEIDWQQILKILVDSQKGISHSAYIELDCQLPLQRSSLKSGLLGHRNYHLKSKFILKRQESNTKLLQQQDFEILYSSTCPQSSHLAKELTKNYFNSRTKQDVLDWLESSKNFIATPHAQRSRMKISLQSTSASVLNVESWINQIEKILQTPVQTAVKKADEMEFARLNAENPMFCEDALRLAAGHVHKQMTVDSTLVAYKIETSHEESLHSHNAAGMIKSKNYDQF